MVKTSGGGLSTELKFPQAGGFNACLLMNFEHGRINSDPLSSASHQQVSRGEDPKRSGRDAEELGVFLVFWQLINPNPRFFDKPGYEEVLELLSLEERDGMKDFVQRKLRERDENTLVDWEEMAET